MSYSWWKQFPSYTLKRFSRIKASLFLRPKSLRSRIHPTASLLHYMILVSNKRWLSVLVYKMRNWYLRGNIGFASIAETCFCRFWPSGKKLGSDERSGSIYDNLMFWILWLKGAEESLKIHKDEWLRNPVVEMVLLKNWFLA
jgi:hypothetical protein